MKDYGEKIKALKEERIRLEIDDIEPKLRDLRPWDYIICEDGIPRIGMELEKGKISDEVRYYFTLKGIAVEESGLYIPDKISFSNLYMDIVTRLARYSYVDWPSNWPTAVDDMVIHTYNHKVYKKPDEILQILGSKLDFQDIRYGIGCIQMLMGSYKHDKYTLGEHNNPRADDFFFYQGFKFNETGSTVSLPERNLTGNGVIRYCFEQLHDHIAEKLIEKIEHDKKSELTINGYLPDGVVDLLKADGILINKYPDVSIISLW